MNEHLTKAAHDLEFARDDLREALPGAGSVEAIVLLDLIAKVAEALNATKAFAAAREADGR